MGCKESKLVNEDTVRRCKERRRLMKDAVHARMYLAVAHSDYCRSLRLTGLALTAFAAGEPLMISDQTPVVLLRTALSISQSQSSKMPPPQPPVQSPPPAVTSPSRYRPSARQSPSDSPTIVSSKLPHILSASGAEKSSRRKFPDIRFDSSGSSSPRNEISNGSDRNYTDWNWNNDYPPSPPNSDYFNRRNNNNNNDEDKASSTYHNIHHLHEEEVEYNEWGHHEHNQYNTTSSSEVDEEDSRSASSAKKESMDIPPPDPMSDNFIIRHKDLEEIVTALNEYFEKAAAAGNQVAEMLETSRMKKKTVYHSCGLFNTLSFNRKLKPPSLIKYKFQAGSMYETESNKSLCSTLERLMAWEKKLYQEIKARETVKIEHEKKLAYLQSREYRGEEVAKLDKITASIKRLQSRIVVTSQAVSVSSTAIIGLRDGELVPQLLELCNRLMNMWKSMNQFHEIQNQIVQQVKGLINKSTKDHRPTTDLHRRSTRDLESSISSWNSSFRNLIKFHLDFIHSLHSWFKLTLIPIKTNSPPPPPPTKETPNAFEFIEEWKLALESVPHTVASEAIKSFVNIIHSISLKQTEEIKMRSQMDTTSKELERKSLRVRNLEKKFYGSYSMVGVGLGLDAQDPLLEKKEELMVCQRKVEDEMVKYSKAVEITRAMTVNNLQIGLPGVCQAMASFSGLMKEALENASSCSYSIK